MRLKYDVILGDRLLSAYEVECCVYQDSFVFLFCTKVFWNRSYINIIFAINLLKVTLIINKMQLIINIIFMYEL